MLFTQSITNRRLSKPLGKHTGKKKLNFIYQLTKNDMLPVPKFKLFESPCYISEEGVKGFIITGIKYESWTSINNINGKKETGGEYVYFSSLNGDKEETKKETQLFATKEELIASL